MQKATKLIFVLFVIFAMTVQVVMAAAPNPVATAAASASAIQNMRFSQSPERVRIVLDFDALPQYKVTLEQQPLRIVVDMAAAVDQKAVRQILLNDTAVSSVTLGNGPDGTGTRAIVNLKQNLKYNVFTLAQPNRLVIDVLKFYDHKVERDVAPGIKYTEWFRGTPAGPVTAYTLTVNSKAGYRIQPLLSNDAIVQLEQVKSMADRSRAIAAVNGSYFDTNGQILGLLKLNGDIVSTGYQTRTALGIMADGSFIIDTPEYRGGVTLPGGQTIDITGVNCERGENDLILYNSYFGSSTGTNEYGVEYVLTGGKIAAINPQNSPLPPGTVVLSAHGSSADKLSGLKVGDSVMVTQTLGPVWDKTVYIMGAGPTLVKNGAVYVTAKAEEFPSDIAVGRAPRTAVGVTKDGRMLLAVVDGRQNHSIGMTLTELARFMRELGAADAMNLDGGGSSEMVVGDAVVNKPSDGRERYVGDALLVLPK